MLEEFADGGATEELEFQNCAHVDGGEEQCQGER